MIHFDQHDPSSEKGRPEHGRASLAGLDYSPLPRLTGRSLALGMLVSMGGLIFGYDTGQISGFLEMDDFKDRFGETDAQGHKSFGNVRAGLIVALLSIGTLVGALGAAPVADRFGRRPCISVSSLVVSVGFVVQIAADRAWYQIMIGRFIAGLGVGALSLAVPMYQAETAPSHIRGTMICFYQLFITMGIFLAACFNLGTYTHYPHSSASWRIVIGLGWLWTLALGLGILCFPESPRWDYRNNRPERAAETLRRVYGAASINHWAVHTQIEEIQSKLRAEDKVVGGTVTEFVGMFRAPRVPTRIMLAMLLQMFQQLTGANYFLYFGTTIFRAVQIDSFVTQVVLNVLNWILTFLGLYLVDSYGRRKSLIVGSLWMSVCLLIFASVGSFLLDTEHPERTKTPGVILIVFACLFIAGYAATWGPMVWAIQAELFPSRYRAKGMALGTASNWTWNFLLAFFSPFISSAIGLSYGYVFAGCNLVGALIVYFLVVESRNRSLEEIDTMYLERVPPRKSSKWIPPPAEEMSRIRKRAGLDLEAEAAAGDDAESTARDNKSAAGRSKSGRPHDDDRGKSAGSADEPKHREHA